MDNIGNGIAGTAFIAYMSSLTSRAYTATQYALFGSLWSVPTKFLAGFSGTVVDATGYGTFFAITAASRELTPMLLKAVSANRSSGKPVGIVREKGRI